MMRSGCYITAITPYSGPMAPVPGIEDYIVTSSAEIGIVQTERARQVIRDCAPIGYGGDIPLVSIGCAGLFAAVMRFADSPAHSARILALETPSDYVQHTLDSARLGAGGDGFVAQDAAHVLDLQKTPEGALARVDHCEILSRPSCFSGTSKLARSFVARLDALEAMCPDARVVTFENVSGYARRLMQAVLAELGPTARREFLQTVECDERHFMTVRPLLDLQHQMAEDTGRPLIVTCLGAGGRIGIFAVSPVHAPQPEPISEARPALEAMVIAEGAGPDLPAELWYMNRSFFGRENFYFEWRINGETFLCTN
ncbi:hypothetical protein GGQ68_001019 [Sagittula marina]|uniref:Uncharacterized protein n=1 Tax=Sagittula marina TaxID=943940 RepID=A0A7W6DRG9_9RHOB|nr:hypothetical protein [Sagittula marina]MBB3984703.1 hypothetical protein [Sagittula marina]